MAPPAGNRGEWTVTVARWPAGSTSAETGPSSGPNRGFLGISPPAGSMPSGARSVPLSSRNLVILHSLASTLTIDCCGSSSVKVSEVPSRGAASNPNRFRRGKPGAYSPVRGFRLYDLEAEERDPRWALVLLGHLLRGSRRDRTSRPGPGRATVASRARRRQRPDPATGRGGGIVAWLPSPEGGRTCGHRDRHPNLVESAKGAQAGVLESRGFPVLRRVPCASQVSDASGVDEDRARSRAGHSGQAVAPTYRA